MTTLHKAAQQALDFCEFLWREVVLNDYAEQLRHETEMHLIAALAKPVQEQSAVWMPIATAPKDRFVLLACPSGFTTTPWVFTTGIMHGDYKTGRWIDHANDDLTDWGMEPTHWMMLPPEPDAASAPPEAKPVQEPVAWAGHDLDAMVEAFSRVIEAHHSSKHPFHNPINMDAQMALSILRGFIQAMKPYTTSGHHELEPVAWMDIDEEGNRLSVRQWSDGNSQEVPLYTAPPNL